MKKKLIVIFSIIIFILAGVWYAFLSDNGKEKGEISVSADPGSVIQNEITPTIIPTITPTATPKLFCYVFICGNVNSPGVYKTEKGNRLADIVYKAGGFSEYADRDYLNLARKVEDGERVYVPSYFETEELSVSDMIAGAGISGGGADDDKGTGDKEQSADRININTADIATLVALPGIGESRARDIVEYRNRVGKFTNPEEIKNISGIGEALFGRIKDYICVE